MTVALFGGAFDPPHAGHLALARAACDHFAADRLVVVPTGRPAHKHVATDPETRFRLAEAAFAGDPRVEVSRHELDRAGASYTVDTARWAADRYGDVVILVGADEFRDFPGWRSPAELLELVRLGVATRPGVEREVVDGVLAQLGRPDRVELFEIPPHPVASRELRARVARGEPIDAFVPPPVARLVEELGLYRG